MTRSPIHWLVLLACVATALLVAVVWVGRPDGGVPRTSGPHTADGPLPLPVARPVGVVAPGRTAQAVDVLRAWDRRRAQAYASGDLAALRRLYASGSRAGTTDVALLREYSRRGLRVVGMRMQLLAVEVLEHRGGHWRLRVTDRLAGATAVDGAERFRLPRDRATTRVVTLWRDPETLRWVVRSVTGAAISRGPTP